jgi:hypothetical protein
MAVHTEEVDVVAIIADGSSDHSVGAKDNRTLVHQPGLALDLYKPVALLVGEVVAALLSERK